MPISKDITMLDQIIVAQIINQHRQGRDMYSAAAEDEFYEGFGYAHRAWLATFLKSLRLDRKARAPQARCTCGNQAALLARP